MAPSTVIADVVRIIDTIKAKLAFLVPLLTALGAAVASWIVSGEFNATEIRAAAGGTVLAAVAGISAYFAPAKQAEVTAPLLPPAVGESQLDPSVHGSTRRYDAIGVVALLPFAAVELNLVTVLVAIGIVVGILAAIYLVRRL